jgi:hypothetical protein
MAEPKRRRLDVMLDPAYLDGLSERGIDDVREMHEQGLEVETELSYVRRLTHGRMSIVKAELDRRAKGGSVGDLVAALPQILAGDDGGTQAPSRPRPSAAASRLPRHLAPAPAIEWRRGAEGLIADATLVNLPTLSDEELTSTLDDLRALEREVSSRRRALHEVLDAVEAELASRHKVGRA